VVGNSHTIRATMTTPTTAASAPMVKANERSTSWTSPRSWSPTRRKTTPSRRNFTIRQKASICSRDAADISVGMR
jgi:outer membrane lipoprotein-sorting protein